MSLSAVLRPTPPMGPLGPMPHRGFTLIEIMVALAIVAITLLAGSQAVSALLQGAQRQSDLLLAQLCAENELIRIRLSRQLPDIGSSSVACEQAGKAFTVALEVRSAPNPNFRRVDAKVLDESTPVLNISTVVNR
jgi:general secretion pathway protein I